MFWFGRYKNFKIVLSLFIVFFLITATSCDEESSGEEFRSVDGSGNNQSNPDMNAILTTLGRIANSDYSDGTSSMAGDTRPNPREVSNAVVAQDPGESIPNELGTSDFLWQWGQFLDHDIDLTAGTDPEELANVSVPTGDIFFDPLSTGTVEISFNRSLFDINTGTDPSNPRQQLNEITGWIDASNVYGSDEERALALRTNDGTGMLKTSLGNLLPFNSEISSIDTPFPNDLGPNPEDVNLFIAGDIRVNEQVGLTSMHTLFLREHNRLAVEIAAENPDFDGERIYQEARKIVGAQMQVITYNEFLPALLGMNALSEYSGYNPDIDSSIMNIFSTAAFRFGHSALSPVLLRLDSEENEIANGNLSLQGAFFSPGLITTDGIEPILRGLANQLHQKIDSLLVSDVRNFLFGPPGAGGLDLASLNIQRGRDHGLPSYNDVREQIGLERVEDFEDVTSDVVIQTNLASIYDSVDDIDVWVGGLSEDPVNGGHLGELFSEIIILQFEVLRDGDRFWYEINLDEDKIAEIETTTLSDIIKRNTNIASELQENVFFVE